MFARNSGVVANCDHTSEEVHVVGACIGMAMQTLTLWKPFLEFHLPARKMQSLLYWFYTSFPVARTKWILIIHRLFGPSPVLPQVDISEIMCSQLTMIATLKTYKPPAASAVLTCTNFEKGSKLPDFSGIVVSTKANQCSTKALFSFRSLILNCRCSCHTRRPFSTP